jgi:hypothetical protein
MTLPTLFFTSCLEPTPQQHRSPSQSTMQTGQIDARGVYIGEGGFVFRFDKQFKDVCT